jgi:broad specificity phosphatase PhoE
MKIYLIRHGETTSDAENRFGGEFDDHLTNKGMFQAEEIAFNLNSSGIEKIYSSPKFRSHETAEILGKSMRCEVEIVDGLRESSRYGILTGMKKDEAKIKFPDQVALASDFYATIIGGEVYQDFKDRVLNAFNSILTDMNKYKEAIAIVSHGGPMRVIIREVLKLGELTEIGECAIITLNYKDKKLYLSRMENASLEKTTKNYTVKN